jgi:uncharacterized protein YggT (Ycf19 family)
LQTLNGEKGERNLSFNSLLFSFQFFFLTSKYLVMIHSLLQLLIFIIIIDALMSWVPQVRYQKWAQILHKIADAPQKPIREMLPMDLPIDPTPMIIIMLIQLLMYVLS